MYASVHGIRIYGRMKRDGTFRIPGLPSGSWPLVVTLEHRERTLRAELQTQAAGPMDIVIE